MASPSTANNSTPNSNPKPFSKTHASFAIDVSGSTAGSILNVECNFITTVASALDNPLQANVLPWNSRPYPPTQLSYLPYLSSSGGTSPSVLLIPNSPQLATLKQADIWFLLTDGQIGTYEVQAFGNAITGQGLHGSPCVIVVFGGLGEPPARCNISVGFAPFATSPNCLFLYRDVRSPSNDEVYLLQAKGCFECLIPPTSSQPEITESTTWNEIPKLNIKEAVSDLLVAEKQELAAEEVSLGAGVTVDTNELYSSHAPVSDDYLIRILGNQRQQQSLAYTSHANGRGGDLRGWLVAQQAPSPPPAYQQQGPPPAYSAIQQVAGLIGSSRPRGDYTNLQSQIQQTHAQQRVQWQAQRRQRVIQQTLSRIDHANRGSYSADGLSVGIDDGGEYDEGDPTDMQSAFRGECPICCQTDTVLSFLLIDDGKPAPQQQQSIWHYPFASGVIPDTWIVSSFLVCEQCAPHLTTSPHGEKIATSLPLVNYTTNRNFWKTRLSKAGFIGRNVPEGQREAVLISVLDTLLRTKEWARPPNTPYNTPWLWLNQPPVSNPDQTDNTARYNAITFALRTLLDGITVPSTLTYRRHAGVNVPLKQALVNQLEYATEMQQTSRFRRNTSVLTEGKMHGNVLYAYPVNGFHLLVKAAAYYGIVPSPNTPSRPTAEGAEEKLRKVLLVKMIHHITGRFMDVATSKGIDEARKALEGVTWEINQLESLKERELLSVNGLLLAEEVARSSWAPLISGSEFVDTIGVLFGCLGKLKVEDLRKTVVETVGGLCRVAEEVRREAMQASGMRV